MKYYHHDHHGEGGHSHEHPSDATPHQSAALTASLPGEALDELTKSHMLLAHMLEHNRHHEEEMASLAERFAVAGEAEVAKKIRVARARMVEANLALMEALGKEG